MSEATFTSPNGGSPFEFVLKVARDAVPTQGDALYAAQRQRTRILERTLKGVDTNGLPFEAYSTKGPYYFYPNGRLGRTKAEKRRNKQAVSRLLRRMADTADRASMAGRSLGTGGVKTQGGQGIKFASYADFKLSIGRVNVDLRGPRAPHMLQAIAVGANFERIIGDEQQIALTDRPAPATVITIGIYGEEGKRAEAHNSGSNPRWAGRHQRKFLDASEEDLGLMATDIGMRCAQRLQRYK